MGSYMPRSRLGLTGSNSFRNSGSIAVLGRAVCNLPGGLVPQRTLHTCRIVLLALPPPSY